MKKPASQPFHLPDVFLSELPTGSVKTAVDTLGRMIARGEFAEGVTIPVEAELCDMLGVSRTVVREATKVLSGKGMLRTARRYGTRVLPFESWNLLDPDVIAWHDPSSPAATRIYAASTQMRMMVEPEAANLAAQNASQAQRDQILSAAQHIDPDPYGMDGMIAADYTFHATILEATGNLILAQLRGLILALLQFSYSTGAKVVPEVKVNRQAHVDVALAIAAANPLEARRLMREMLTENRETAEMIVKANPGE
ncbi:FadR/GntR family transcriptional regulator [Cognatishimia sp.]|uniref:FadR/GntR family transcriptional regulator n=1 Tax=Cognatishimia sp. TaxID=2211648 RepID=UPI003512676F|nr:FadR family transcriptional regulator [Cognatishimia sp.]